MKEKKIAAREWREMKVKERNEKNCGVEKKWRKKNCQFSGPLPPALLSPSLALLEPEESVSFEKPKRAEPDSEHLPAVVRRSVSKIFSSLSSLALLSCLANLYS